MQQLKVVLRERDECGGFACHTPLTRWCDVCQLSKRYITLPSIGSIAIWIESSNKMLSSSKNLKKNCLFFIFIVHTNSSCFGKQTHGFFFIFIFVPSSYRLLPICFGKQSGNPFLFISITYNPTDETHTKQSSPSIFSYSIYRFNVYSFEHVYIKNYLSSCFAQIN